MPIVYDENKLKATLDSIRNANLAPIDTVSVDTVATPAPIGSPDYQPSQQWKEERRRKISELIPTTPPGGPTETDLARQAMLDEDPSQAKWGDMLNPAYKQRGEQARSNMLQSMPGDMAQLLAELTQRPAKTIGSALTGIGEAVQGAVTGGPEHYWKNPTLPADILYGLVGGAGQTQKTLNRPTRAHPLPETERLLSKGTPDLPPRSNIDPGIDEMMSPAAKRAEVVNPMRERLGRKELPTRSGPTKSVQRPFEDIIREFEANKYRVASESGQEASRRAVMDKIMEALEQKSLPKGQYEVGPTKRLFMDKLKGDRIRGTGPYSDIDDILNGVDDILPEQGISKELLEGAEGMIPNAGSLSFEQAMKEWIADKRNRLPKRENFPE